MTIYIANTPVNFGNLSKLYSSTPVITKTITSNQVSLAKPALTFGLGAATIAAQQKLSNKSGIPTFNVKGGLSTVPRTIPYNPNINVGTGSTGLSLSAFQSVVSALSPQGALIPSATAPIITTGLPSSVQSCITGYSDSGRGCEKCTDIKGDIPKENQLIPESISNYISKINPIYLLGFVALTAIMVLKR